MNIEKYLNDLAKRGMSLLKEEVIILQTSDLHGKVFPEDDYDKKEVGQGLLKVSTVIQDERKKAKDKKVILIDNGDLIQGSPMMDYYVKYLQEENHPMIHSLNEMKYDVFVPGNHEFNFGLNLLNKAKKASNFPWLAANIVCEKTKEPYFGKPYVIKTIASDLKIGILGLTTSSIPLWEDPKNIKGLQFLNVTKTAKKWIHYLKTKEKANFIIVAYHGGLEENLTGLTETERNENEGIRLCEKIDEIDCLLTGHQHRLIENKYINETLIIQPGARGTHVGKIHLTFSKENDSWICRKKIPSLIEVNNKRIDLQLKEYFKPFYKKTNDWLDKPLGKAKQKMTVPKGIDAFTSNHPYIDLINRIQMEATNTNISLACLFSKEVRGFSREITMRQIVKNYPYPNSLKVLRLTGEDIKNALEKTATFFTINDEGELKINRSFLYPKEEIYQYDIWKGIEYELDIRKPFGQRVTKLIYNDEEIKEKENYEVVMNNYRAFGGGGYTMFRQEKVIFDYQVNMIELLEEYVKKHQEIDIKCENHFEVVY